MDGEIKNEFNRFEKKAKKQHAWDSRLHKRSRNDMLKIEGADILFVLIILGFLLMIIGFFV